MKPEAIAIAVITIPMVATSLIIGWTALSISFSRFGWWKSLMEWYLMGAWIPRDDDADDELFASVMTFCGIAMILVPCITMFIFSYYTNQPISDYIMTEWRNVKLTL